MCPVNILPRHLAVRCYNKAKSLCEMPSRGFQQIPFQVLSI